MEKYFNKVERKRKIADTKATDEDLAKDPKILKDDENGREELVVCKPHPLNTDIKRVYVNCDNGLNVLYFPYFLPTTSANEVLWQLEKDLVGYYKQSPNKVIVCGKEHGIPRQQTAFGDPGLTYSFSGVTIPAHPWIPPVERLKVLVQETLQETFNFVLVNRYKDGRDHMGEHRDDEADLCPKSSIASLSFGQERDFIFRHKDARGSHAHRRDISPVKLQLAHGSLLVMEYPTNTYWYHSLPVRRGAINPRVNLTFRKMKA